MERKKSSREQGERWRWRKEIAGREQPINSRNGATFLNSSVPTMQAQPAAASCHKEGWFSRTVLCAVYTAGGKSSDVKEDARVVMCVCVCHGGESSDAMYDSFLIE